MKPLLRLTQKKWINWLRQQPETGMGYVVVTVVLKDGRRIERVAIAGAFVADIYGRADIPFTEEDIAEMIVTHHKWDFQTGREIGELPHP